ncbi:MAG TPA: serine hydrolase [Streptosporangiaceae bacterium]|nr:serine hydrolase [Streptosporangiaceae bacterium]
MDLAGDMQSIERFVSDQLAAWEVPGCAAAAVQDGQVVLATGWGQRDLATKLPVTADTLFAIGSTTKAFTAATVGALVDDGLLDWERPLRDYVPEIQLHDPVVSDRLTVVDLLSHRSGLPRHEMAWLGHPGRSRAELVRRLRFLPLSKDLRQAFQYCNLGYLAAGYAVEVLSGTPWEDYLRDRLLTPLGMGRSNLSVDEMSADPDHATAYERRQGVVVPVPQRPITALAPAGAINSCAADLTRWLLAQLGDGQLDGQAVMSAASVARQHEPHIVLPEDRTFPASTRHAYGLGWFVGRYRGHRLLEHGGGIDGFLTECMLLPDDGIGVAVMTNTTSSVMTPVVAYRILDELLGLEPLDWFSSFKPRYDTIMAGMREARQARRVVPDAPLPRPLDAYAGEYEHPGYGTLTLTLEDGVLRPRLGTLDLSLAHRHYETFDLEWHELGDQSHPFPLMFLSDPDGDLTALTVPFESLIEAQRFDRRPDASAQDPEVLRRLCGTYVMGPIEVVVALRGDRVLTVAIPGAPPFELESAGRGLRFGLKGQPAVTTEFELDESGQVARLVAQPLGIFQPKP